MDERAGDYMQSPDAQDTGRGKSWIRGRLRGPSAVAALTTGALTVAAFGAAPASANTAGLGYDPLANKGSLYHIAEVVGAHDSYAAGYTGQGVGVALIDTGVTEVPGLDTGNVVHGPDLSFDSQVPELRHKDAYGHGTHLGSIIAGRDEAGTPASYADPARFTGIAPDATLVNLKVGAYDGAVDVTQVIAAIDWAVEHRDDPGLNIRVINLSYGVSSLEDSSVDPLAFAVENAWKKGIVVVAAGGNDGRSTKSLAMPARDPYVLSVGAVDTHATVTTADDDVPHFASRGTNRRHVDTVAPGVSVLGLRVANGYADERNPLARVGTRFAKASGTSQSAAVTSGVVALLLQRSPALTPDQVKKLLTSTADGVELEKQIFRGKGVPAVRNAQNAKVDPTYKQSSKHWGDGTGSIESARGGSHVHDGVAPISGEVDIFGNPWDGAAWAAATADDTVWEGGKWRGIQLTGDGFDGRVWKSATWTSGSWSGRLWAGSDWSGRLWANGSWSGRLWANGGWSGRLWADAGWTGSTWRTADLASAGWR
jgi:serine protease AprX